MTTTTAPAIAVTAIRTRKGTKASIAVTAILPDGTEYRMTMSGARADRAVAVWVTDWRSASGRVRTGCSADAATVAAYADRARTEHVYTYRNGGSSTIEAVPAGWALVEEASA